MWYFAWLLGTALACILAIAVALWLDSAVDIPTRDD